MYPYIDELWIIFFQLRICSLTVESRIPENPLQVWKIRPL